MGIVAVRPRRSVWPGGRRCQNCGLGTAAYDLCYRRPDDGHVAAERVCGRCERPRHIELAEMVDGMLDRILADHLAGAEPRAPALTALAGARGVRRASQQGPPQGDMAARQGPGHVSPATPNSNEVNWLRTVNGTESARLGRTA